MSEQDSQTNPYQAPENGRGIWSIRDLAVAAIVAIVLITLLLPVGYESVFDGHYDLSIVVPQNDQIDASSLLFAACWTIQEAQSAVAKGIHGTASFERGTLTTSNTHVISVPYSGRSDQFGRVASYNQPQYLVVEYEFADSPSTTVRKQVAIPQGRGDRSITVQIPQPRNTIAGTRR